MNNKQKFIAKLDPEIAPALDRGPILDGSLTLAENRRRAEAFWADYEPPPPHPLVKRVDHLIDGPAGPRSILVRLYYPIISDQAALLPAYLWFHGGGFFLGSVAGADPICEQTSLSTGCVVASVEYRLLPDSPFPAAVEDGYRALQWLHSQGNAIGIKADNIGIGGVSAGGCLAAAIALMARDRNGPELSCQLLEYPCLDDRLETPSAQAITELTVWNKSIASRMWQQYLCNSPKPPSCYAAPARATTLAGLPPAYLLIAEHDLLRDEGIAYAQRLMQAGVSTELHVYPGTIHLFDMLAPSAKVSRRAVDERIAFLRHHLPAPHLA